MKNLISINTAIFSIKPKFVSLIFAGEKTVELRRKLPRRIREGSKIFIWETSPKKRLSGCVRVQKLLEVPIDQLWELISDFAGINEDEFYNYFDGLSSGIAVFLSDAEEFQVKPELNYLRDKLGFNPPQSFRYVSPDELEYLEASNLF